jgi:hypothetical protein
LPDFLWDPTVARLFYFTVVVVGSLLAARSRHLSVIALAAILTLDYAVSNLIFSAVGPGRAPLYNSAAVAVFAVASAWVAKSRGSHAAWAVVGLYVASAAIGLGATILGVVGSRYFYLTLNLVMLLRWAVVDASGVVLVQHDAGVRRRDRAGHSAPG